MLDVIGVTSMCARAQQSMAYASHPCKSDFCKEKTNLLRSKDGGRGDVGAITAKSPQSRGSPAADPERRSEMYEEES